MSKIWFCSDWHLCHDRDFIYSPRGFKNVAEMNETIINNHNKVVNIDDDVYMLGDAILNNNEEGIRCIKKLKGNIHIILGNHDTAARRDLYKQCHNVVEVCDAKFLKVNNQMLFLSHYPCLCDNHDSNKPLDKRVISICGHTHTQDKFSDFSKGLIYHVDMDAHNCTPISFEDIMDDIKNKVKN